MKNKAKQMAFANALRRWENGDDIQKDVGGTENETARKGMIAYCPECRQKRFFESQGLSRSGRWEHFKCTGREKLFKHVKVCEKAIFRPAPKKNLTVGHFFVQSLTENPEENQRGINQPTHEWLNDLGISPVDELPLLAEKGIHFTG